MPNSSVALALFGFLRLRRPESVLIIRLQSVDVLPLTELSTFLLVLSAGTPPFLLPGSGVTNAPIRRYGRRAMGLDAHILKDQRVLDGGDECDV